MRELVIALACVVGTLAIPRWSAAATTIQYGAEARWYSTAPDDRSQLLTIGPSATPVSIGSLAPIDGRRPPGPCPDPTTNDYLCLRAYGAADGFGVLHAAARLTRKNIFGPVGHFARGIAAVTFQGMNVVSSVPVAYGYVYIGLVGTTSSSGSGGTVDAYSTVNVNNTEVVCTGNVCEPLQIPNFDGSYLSVSLLAYVGLNAPDQVPVDATGDADFLDTLTVQAIELHDASDQKIPDAMVTLSDQSDNVIFTFPNSAPTTTTTLPGATTTTTLPAGGCEVAATYASIECRLAALDTIVKASAGKLAPKRSKLLAKATDGIQKAASPGTPHNRVAKGLHKATHALKSYDTLLGSKKAKRLLDDATRSSLQAAGAAIAADVATLP